MELYPTIPVSVLTLLVDFYSSRIFLNRPVYGTKFVLANRTKIQTFRRGNRGAYRKATSPLDRMDKDDRGYIFLFRISVGRGTWANE